MLLRLCIASKLGLRLALLMSAMFMLLAPGAAQGSFPGANGVIAYTGEISKFQTYRSEFLREPTGTAIWALEPETGDQRQLTTGPADAAPSFSPSGNMLAFQRHGAKGWTIFLARADGSEAKPLVSGTQPAFSPDGQEIVFVRPTGLFVTGIAPGSPVRRVTHHRGDTDPEWSTSGMIAFERTYEKYFPHLRVISNLLDVINPPRSRIRTLLTYTYADGQLIGGFPLNLNPDWSPDSKTIAATLCIGEPGAVPSRLDTTPRVLLSQSSCEPRAWTPAGRDLAEADTGRLQPKQETTCPSSIAYSGGEAPEYASISWQPLRPETLRVPTMPCEPRPVPTGDTATKASNTSSGTTCIWFDHKKKCHQQR